MTSGLRPSAKARALVMEFEGCETKLPDGRLEAYPDPGSGAEPWTIGWGSTTDLAGKPIRRGTIWTQAQADARLEVEIGKVGTLVADALAGAPATQDQFDALVSFTYNLGIANLRKSTLLKLHKARQYGGAALQFALWNKAKGRVMPGLTRRRAAEAALYAGKAR